MCLRDQGDRGALVALGLLLIAVVLVATIAPWSGEPADQEMGQPHAREVQQSPGNDVSQPVAGQRNDPWADSYAQWIMAVFGVIATGVSIWAVRLVRDTLAVNRAAVAAAVRAAEAADHAVDVTREMGAAQTRAYLVVTAGEVIYDGFGLPKVNIKIRNTGQSPAFDVKAVYQLSRREHFTAAPTGAKGGLKVAEAPMAQMIGGGREEKLTILSVIVTDDTVIDRNTPDFSIEGVIEYKTVFGENSWDIDTRTSFLFHTLVDHKRLTAERMAGERSKHPMQLMPAFMSGWVIDYRRTIAAIREGERRAKAKDTET